MVLAGHLELNRFRKGKIDLEKAWARRLTAEHRPDEFPVVSLIHGNRTAGHIDPTFCIPLNLAILLADYITFLLSRQNKIPQTNDLTTNNVNAGEFGINVKT